MRRGACLLQGTLNNIGSLEGTLHYNHQATPGDLLGLHGDCTEGFPFKEPIMFRVLFILCPSHISRRGCTPPLSTWQTKYIELM